MTEQAMTNFGPNGEAVFLRTYSRPLPEGGQENYSQMIDRVALGNFGLVYGYDVSRWPDEIQREFQRFTHYMSRGALIPAGRHLWASGVKGRQFLYNCHVSGWGEKFSDHFDFTFMRLMEGGGVGANYSAKYLRKYGAPRRALRLHVVCDPAHQDFEAMKAAGVLSQDYTSDWAGAYDVEDSREGWSEGLCDLLGTYMTDETVKHADRVYDVSRVRPKGSRLKQFGGTASGPLSWALMMHEVTRVMNEQHDHAVAVGFLNARSGEDYGRPYVSGMAAMEIDHAIAECVVSGGVRRSARMAQMHWLDPFIFSFIESKGNTGKHWTTNISIEIDDEFTAALNDETHEDHVHAHEVHRAAIKGMLTNGEPGYWNSSLSNVGEVNHVQATNPCGEIALPEWGACVLGHVNLDAFAPKSKWDAVDWDGMFEAHELMTRFLIRATYGDMNDPKQKAVMDSERRIGVGHLGVQGFLVKNGMRYSEAPKDNWFPDTLRDLYKAVRKAARDYAFALRIAEPVKVTTVAPTGSVAKLFGVTEGLQAIIYRYYDQRIRYSMVDADQAATVEAARQAGYTVEVDSYDSTGNTAIVVYPTKHGLVQQVEDMGYDPAVVESQGELTLAQALDFQAMYQSCYADNAISMTVNVAVEPHQQAAMLAGSVANPSEGRIEDVAVTMVKYLDRLKGTTIMPDGTRPQAPYTEISQADYELARFVLVGDGIDENCATGACPVR